MMRHPIIRKAVAIIGSCALVLSSSIQSAQACTGMGVTPGRFRAERA